MNWKAEAVEKLRKYESMRRSLYSIPTEIKRLEIQACGVKAASADVQPIKGGGSRQEDRLLNNLVHRQELQWALEEAQCWMKSTNLALAALSAQEKLVLQRLYICPESGGLERLCGELGIEKSSVYRKREEALRKFTLALYGAVESK